MDGSEPTALNEVVNEDGSIEMLTDGNIYWC
jgi:hypothetical protein